MPRLFVSGTSGLAVSCTVAAGWGSTLVGAELVYAGAAVLAVVVHALVDAVRGLPVRSWPLRTHREDFFEKVIARVRRAIVVRAVYLALRDQTAGESGE